MPFLNKLETKFSRFAIPGLIRILAIFQIVVWAMVMIQPDFLAWIVLDKNLVLDGQVWRLFTWPFYMGPIWWVFVLFYTQLLFTMSDALEEAWGVFRVNLFIFGGILATLLETMFLSPEILEGAPLNPDILFRGVWLNTSILLAFACLVPQYEILVFFVLPVKMKWIGILNGVFLLLQGLSTPSSLIPIFFSILNFLVAFGPAFVHRMKHKGVVTERRARFVAARKSETPHFHKCASCGKTELDDKTLDFRVGSDGEEYCSECKPRKKEELPA